MESREDTIREPLLHNGDQQGQAQVAADGIVGLSKLDAPEEAPPGLIAYEHTHTDLFETGSHWLQVRLLCRFDSVLAAAEVDAFTAVLCYSERMTFPFYTDHFCTTSTAAWMGNVAHASKLREAGVGHRHRQV